MRSKHICPHCGGKEFYTVAHIMEEWLVDEDGDFIAVSTNCIEIDHEPDDDNIWTCKYCGEEAIVVGSN